MDYNQSNSGNQQPRQYVQTQEITHKQADLDIDEELKQLIASHKTRIKVVGCGGAGNNTIQMPKTCYTLPQTKKFLLEKSLPEV